MAWLASEGNRTRCCTLTSCWVTYFLESARFPWFHFLPLLSFAILPCLSLKLCGFAVSAVQVVLGPSQPSCRHRMQKMQNMQIVQIVQEEGADHEGTC